MKVGELFATLSLKDAEFQKQLRNAQKLGDQFAKQFAKPINVKNMFSGLNTEAAKVSRQAAQQIKSNLGNAAKGIDFSKAVKGLNFKFDFAGLNSITTGFSAAGAAAGLAGAAIGVALNKIKEGFDAVVEKGMAFEQQMSAVAAVTFAGQDMGSAEVQKAFKALEDQAISLGASTTFTAQEVGSAQELLAKAGFEVNEIMAATPGLLAAAAAAEGITLAQTADIASSALRGFGLSANDMNMVADVLAKTAATSNASIVGMGESFKYIAPVAQAVGLNIHDTSAAIGLLANMGIKGSIAGRNLASGIMALTAPSKEASALMKELGISVVTSTGEFKQLPDIFANIETATKGMTDAQKLATVETIVGKDNAKTYLGILNSQYKAMENGVEVTLSGSEAMRALSGSLQDSTGAAREMANIRLDNLAGDMEMLSGAADSMAIQMYKKAQPALRAMAQGATQALQTIAPIAIEAFGAIVDGAMMIRDAAMPGLIQAWNALKPAIASIIPIIGNVLGGFAVFASQAVAWGSKIVAGLAQGMAQAVQRVVAILKYIGSVISYWLRPNSPPKIVPDLDTYGTEAGQLYIDSFGNADVSGAMSALGAKVTDAFTGLAKDAEPVINAAGISLTAAFIQGMQGWDSGSFAVFEELTGSVEESIRSLGESGAMAKDAIVPAIMESRSAVMQFVNSMRETGEVSEESMNNLLSSLGPVGPEIEGLVRSYAELALASKELAEANEEVARAQEEVNRVTAEYDSRLAPLTGQMAALDAEKKRLQNAKRLQELNKKIAEGKLDENELALAQLEIEEINLQSQIDAVETEKEVAVDAAEEKLKAAEDQQEIAETAQKAAQAQYDAAQAQISVTKENNALMQEQVKILADIAQAQRDAANAAANVGGGGGLGGGGMPDIGGMPSIEEMPIDEMMGDFEELGSQFSELGSQISEFQTGFNTGKQAITDFFTAFTNPALPNFGSQLSGIQGIISGVGSTINSMFVQPLMVLWGIITTNVVPALTAIGNRIQETFQTKGGPVMAQFASLMSTLGGIFNSLKPVVAGLVTLVGGGLLFAFVGIAEILTNALPGALQAFGGILQFINGVVQLVIGTIVGLGQTLGAVFSGDLPAAGVALNAVWTNIQTASANIVSGIMDTFIGLGGSLAGIAAGIFEDIYAITTGKVINVRDEVTRIIGEMKDNALTYIQDLYNGVVKWFQDLYNTLVGHSIVPDMVEGIIKWFSELPAKVVAFVEQVYKDVIKWFTDLKTNAITIFGDMSTEAVRKFEELKTNVTTAVTNLATEIGALATTFLTEAKSIGTGIVDGIKSGIEAGKAAVRRAVEALASLIPQWAKDMLGIKSPSKVMEEEVGLPSTEGIAVGIEAGIPMVKRALDAVKSAIIQPLIKVRDEAAYLFDNISDIFKGVADFIGSISTGTSIISGLLPSRDEVQDLRKQYKELTKELEEASVGIEDIEAELLEKRKAIQDELVQAVKDTNKKIIDLEEERAKIEAEIAQKSGENSEQFALKQQIDRLSAIADPNDVLMQERIAALRMRYSEIAKENEADINDLLDKRTEIDNDLASARVDLDERRLELQAELQDAELNADKDRQEALQKQLDILEQLQQVSVDFGNAKGLYNYLQSIAESTQKIFQQARVQIGELESLNPAAAADFFKEFQSGVQELAKLEQDYLTETLNPDGVDNRKLSIITEQLALARRELGVDLSGLQQEQIEGIMAKLKEIEKLRTEGDGDEPVDLNLLANQEAALMRQLAMIEDLNLASLIPDWFNTGSLSGSGGVFGTLPALPEPLRDAVYDRRDASATPVDLESLFNRLISALQPDQSTNFVINGTYQQNQNAMTVAEEIRLKQLLGGV